MARRSRLRWSGPALDDLREIRDYIGRDNPSAASKVAQTIRDAVLRLKEHPQSGRAVPGFSAFGYREVVVAPYRIVYLVQKTDVIILRVWHGRRAFE